MGTPFFASNFFRSIVLCRSGALCAQSNYPTKHDVIEYQCFLLEHFSRGDRPLPSLGAAPPIFRGGGATFFTGIKRGNPVLCDRLCFFICVCVTCMRDERMCTPCANTALHTKVSDSSAAFSSKDISRLKYCTRHVLKVRKKYGVIENVLVEYAEKSVQELS